MQHRYIFFIIFDISLDFMHNLRIFPEWLSETQKPFLKGESMTKPCKHKFRPRYDEVWTTVIGEMQNSMYEGKTKGGSLLAEPYLKEKTYIHDICVKCGQIVKRGDSG